MSLGLIGRKIGMMRVFTEAGVSVPVTVIEMASNRVAQIKTCQKDGYSAVQLAYGSRRASRVNRAQAGHYSAASVEAAATLVEFRVEEAALNEFRLGAALSVEIFSVGQKVDVSGVTQGKGFAGSIKRHNFSSQRASHGNSISHNAPGSIGMAQDPGRVFPGKRMAGQMGNVNRTTQNLEVVRVDLERGLLLVKGAVPGSKGGRLLVRPAVKAKA
jgi:large subunit ribosomal protein L3